MENKGTAPKGTFIQLLADQTWARKGAYIILADDMKLEDSFALVKNAGIKRQVPESELAIIWDMRKGDRK